MRADRALTRVANISFEDRQLLTDLYRIAEARSPNRVPSKRRLFAAARQLGGRFRDADAYAMYDAFDRAAIERGAVPRKAKRTVYADSGPQPGIIAPQTGTDGQQNSRTRAVSGSIPEASGRNRAAASRERDKVVLSTTLQPAAGASPGNDDTSNEPWAFASWLAGEARDRGLRTISESNFAPEVRADLKAAKVLLETHGMAEARRRASRMLEGVATGALQRVTPSVRGLAKAWDYGVVASDLALAASRRPERTGDARFQSGMTALADINREIAANGVVV